MNNIIEVENISKKYRLGEQSSYVTLRDQIASWWNHPKNSRDKDTFWALKGIAFNVSDGETLGIIGKNGAGKSTLLRILSRITTPTTGKIVMRGRVASLLEVGTGFHHELTGRENIYLNGGVLGMSRKEISKKFDAIVDFSGIEKFLDTPVKHYSSGMYMRLAFAIAAQLEPEILIVDEVLAVGDAEFQKKCLGKMQEDEKSGRTIIFVSHNMGAINQLCGRSLWLDKGKIVASGKTGEVVNKYLLSSFSRGTVYTQPHTNKEMNLRKVLLNPGFKNKSGEVFYDDPIVIRLEFEVNRTVSGCTVWLALQTMEGIIVFVTADYDYNREKLGKRPPGVYKNDILIPKMWLNSGEYTVIVGLVHNDPLIIYDRVETIRFTVIDNGTTPEAIIKSGSRRGVLQPYLNWRDV